MLFTSVVLHGYTVSVFHMMALCAHSHRAAFPVRSTSLCTGVGIGELQTHTNRKAFCRVESLLLYGFTPLHVCLFCFFFLHIQGVYVWFNSTIIQENPELNQTSVKRGSGKGDKLVYWD